MATTTPFQIRIPIAKRDEKAGIVYGWGALSNDEDGLPIIDSDDEYIPIDELAKAVHDLFRRGGAGMGGEMHERFAVADVIASMPLDSDTREKYGFGKGVSGWAVGLQITDPETRKRVFSGELPELSIRGRADRIEVEKLAGIPGQGGTKRRYKILKNLELSD